LLAVAVLFNHTDPINGWSLGQMIVLLGVYYLRACSRWCSRRASSASWSTSPGHARLHSDQAGQQPVHDQHAPRPGRAAGAGRLRCRPGRRRRGRTGEVIGPGELVRFVVTLVTLVCGLSLVYCLVLVLATVAFWATRIENLLAIFWSFLDAGRFPVDVYPGWLRVTLSTVPLNGLVKRTGLLARPEVRMLRSLALHAAHGAGVGGVDYGACAATRPDRAGCR
jgi:ABC-2 family transporter protein